MLWVTIRGVRPRFASIAQLAEHVLRKHKVTSSILVGGSPVVSYQGRWSRGMILPSGGRGRGFDSRTAPGDLFYFFFEKICFSRWRFKSFQLFRRGVAPQPSACWPLPNSQAPSAGQKSYIHEAEER